jgi:AsmA protein
MRRTLILLASLAIMLLGMWGSAVIFLDEDRLKSIVTTHLSEQTGRKLEIRGSLSVRFFPGLRVHAEDVVVSGPEGFDGPDLLETEQLTMSVRLLPLIRGNFSPGEVSVRNATLHLTTNRQGQSTVDGLLSSPDHPVERGVRLLSTRQMRLEDVRVVISDMVTERVDSLQIDYVELDRFAFDEALEFRFRGNLGEPPLFSSLEVEGLLLVPSTRQRPMRLANMRLSGRLIDGGQPVQLLGHLSMSSLPPLQLYLHDGRMDIAGQTFDIEAGYDAAADSVLRLAVHGEGLAWPLAGVMPGESEHASIAYLRGLDTDIAVTTDQARLHGLEIEQFVLRMSSREGVVTVHELQGLAPGAVISGHGHWDLLVDPVEGELELELAIDELGHLLEGLDVPADLSGSGHAMMAVKRSPLSSGDSALATGKFEIWGGRWAGPFFGHEPVADESSSVNSLENDSLAFNRLAGSFRWMPDAFDVPEFSLGSPEGEVFGWLSVARSDYAIAGLLTRVADGQEIVVAGQLDHPIWSGTQAQETGDGEP